MLVNDVLQRTLGNLRNFEANVDAKVVGDWAVFLAHMNELGIDPQHLDYVEVGTGWYPTLPLCFSLAGARSCRTFDVAGHLKKSLLFRMLRRLHHHLPLIAQVSKRSPDQVKKLYSALLGCRTVKQLLCMANIEYIAPADAADTKLPDSSVNVVYSNSVLEHVPTETIVRIMQESMRILKPGGLAIHSANCGDHYAYCDRAITAINYLRFTEQQWRKWNNSLLYQNRLRPQDFLDTAKNAGLQLVLVKYRPREDLIEALRDLPIAAEFTRYPPDQLATTSIDFVARRPEADISSQHQPQTTLATAFGQLLR
jgi:SAM-dependent methyltransferase